MKCRNCPKVATLHITEILHGQVQEHHLCEDCARPFLEKTASPAAPPGVTASDESESEEHEQLVCPGCEMTFKEFRSQGRLGCPHCYTAFQAELMPLLENIHGETRHCGKVPRKAPQDHQAQYQLMKLRNDLRQAVVEESYERAAKLRDQIQELETQLSAEE